MVQFMKYLSNFIPLNVRVYLGSCLWAINIQYGVWLVGNSGQVKLIDAVRGDFLKNYVCGNFKHVTSWY